MTGHEQDRAVQAEAFSAAGEGLRTVRLAPWGEVASTHGKFLVDDQAARETIAAFDAHEAAVPIDIEHESLAGREPATGARGAIGWIEKVFHEVGRGLFALVKWSEKGKELIRSDAFRYLSPVFLIDKATRRVIALHSAAITTLPALVKAELLAASRGAGTETTGDVADALGVECKGETQAVLAACCAKATSLQGIIASVRTALGLPADADGDAIVVGLAARVQGDASGSATAELAAMKAQVADRDAEALIALHGKGKLNPNATELVAMFKEIARTDPARFVKVMSQMPVICPEGRTTPPSSRQLAIMKAESAFRADPRHAKVTSCVAFVNDVLRTAGLVKLTENEVAELRIG